MRSNRDAGVLADVGLSLEATFSVVPELAVILRAEAGLSFAGAVVTPEAAGVTRGDLVELGGPRFVASIGLGWLPLRP